MPLDKNFNKRKLDAVIVKNEGIPFQLEAINEVRINKSAVEKRCASATNRRTVKKHNQVAWLLKAITCMDLTTLSGDDTESRVVRLCNKGPFHMGFWCHLTMGSALVMLSALASLTSPSMACMS